MRSETFSMTDNEITAVDGVRFEKRGYFAHDAARTALGSACRARCASAARCACSTASSELNVDPGCIYRPAVPGYPRDALDQPAERRVAS